MPRCYFFNLVETPTFVTTGYLSETFCENPKCGHPEKNDNDQAWEKWQWTSSEAIFLVVIFQHLRPRSGPQLTSAARPFHLLTKSEKSESEKSGFWLLKRKAPRVVSLEKIRNFSFQNCYNFGFQNCYCLGENSNIVAGHMTGIHFLCMYKISFKRKFLHSNHN